MIAVSDMSAMPDMLICTHFTLFDTAFGRCALAWSEHSLTAVRLPDHSDALTRANLLARQPGAIECDADAAVAADAADAAALPRFVANALRSIRSHLAGQPNDLRNLPLDFSGIGPFEQRVYLAARALGPGQTCTYGELAHALGEPTALRAVAQALGHNPWPLVIPCHRVLAAGGRLGGFSAPGGSETKRRLLVLDMGMFRREGQLF